MKQVNLRDNCIVSLFIITLKYQLTKTNANISVYLNKTNVIISILLSISWYFAILKIKLSLSGHKSVTIHSLRTKTVSAQSTLNQYIKCLKILMTPLSR